MAAINHQDLRRFKAWLRLGADPNQPWPLDPSGPTFPLVLPLAHVLDTYLPQKNPWADALIAAGADVAFCLHWLSVSNSPSWDNVSDALTLCEIVERQPTYRQAVRHWLAETSVKLRKMAAPTDQEDLELWAAVQHRFDRVGRRFKVVHKMPAWALAQVL